MRHNFVTGMCHQRATQWCSWLRNCATRRKVAGSIPDGVVGIFHSRNPLGHTMALWSRLSLEHKWVPGIFPGCKGCYFLRLTTLPPSCADCHEIWEPQPLGNLGACPGIALPFLCTIKSETELRKVILIWLWRHKLKWDRYCGCGPLKLQCLGYMVLVSKIDGTSLNVVTQEQHCAFKLFQSPAFIFPLGTGCVFYTAQYRQNMYGACEITRNIISHCPKFSTPSRSWLSNTQNISGFTALSVGCRPKNALFLSEFLTKKNCG